MISVIVCSREIENINIHKEHIIKSAGKSIEYILIDNSNNDYNLCSAYNTGVSKATGDLLLFMHDDVFPVTQNWATLIENKFHNTPSMGALGVAGTSYLYKDDAFWCRPGKPFVKGKVIHEFKKSNELVITVFSDENRDQEVVIIDGLFMVIRADLFNKKISFDEKNFNGFHLYDLDISMQIGKSEKLFVTEDILVKHMSSGIFGEQWQDYATIFLNKYKDLLPASCTEQIPDPKNRIPFNSPSLYSILKKETADSILSIGKRDINSDPNFSFAQNQFSAQKYEETIKTLNTLLERNPNSHDAWHLLGLAQFKVGDLNNAINCLKKAASNDNNNPMLYYNIGTILIEQGNYSEALQFLNKAIQIKSDFIEALNKMTHLLSLLGELSLAKKTCETILNHSPNNHITLNNLGNICKDLGEINIAINYYKKALQLKPDYFEAFSNLLLNSHYSIEDPKELWSLHQNFGEYVSNIIKPIESKKIKDTSKRIKIGYLSPDFRTHSVSYFIKSILEKHNKEKFEIFCYSDNAIEDNITKILKSNTEHWLNVGNLNNHQLTEAIRNDKLDIIIDLAGHSGNNRITIYQSRLATNQITYLGYPDTTGLPEMDYRITDKYSEATNAQAYYSEKLIFLKNSFLSYSPAADLPESKETPAILNKFITFGSFNNFSKISNVTFNLWIQIIKSVPHSKLNLKCRALNDKSIQKKVIDRFSSEGIEKDRLIFHGYSATLNEHLKCYNHLDIALDTFPYNGTTTTCEALSMGVPVITLKGLTHASRVSSSILENCNQSNLIANSQDDYVNKAIELSKNFEHLNKTRILIRDQFLKSPICNSEQFINDYEATLEKVINE